jgi:hypothetical protein
MAAACQPTQEIRQIANNQLKKSDRSPNSMAKIGRRGDME